MKITVATKNILKGSILKDSDGYYMIMGYLPEFGWYEYVECDKHGNRTSDKFDDGVLTPIEIIGSEIITLYLKEDAE